MPITPLFYFLLRMPVAQVQLMAVDQSVVVYPKKDSIKLPNGKVREFSQLSKDDIKATNDWWERRKKEIEEIKNKKRGDS